MQDGDGPEKKADAWLQEWSGDFGQRVASAPVEKKESKDTTVLRTTDPVEIRRIMLKHMQPGETVTRALKRLGQKTKPEIIKKPTGYGKSAREAADALRKQPKPQLSPEEAARDLAFKELTEAADLLLQQGDYGTSL